MDISLLSNGQLNVAGHALNAEQVSTLIVDLARHRALMQPPVPLRLDPDSKIHLTDRPELKITHTNDAQTVLGLRHAGFGWCWFVFDAPSAATLRDYLIRHTKGAPTTGLFEDSLPGGVQ